MNKENNKKIAKYKGKKFRGKAICNASLVTNLN